MIASVSGPVFGLPGGVGAVSTEEVRGFLVSIFCVGVNGNSITVPGSTSVAGCTN